MINISTHRSMKIVFVYHFKTRPIKHKSVYKSYFCWKNKYNHRWNWVRWVYQMAGGKIIIIFFLFSNLYIKIIKTKRLNQLISWNVCVCVSCPSFAHIRLFVIPIHYFSYFLIKKKQNFFNIFTSFWIFIPATERRQKKNKTNKMFSRKNIEV